jgi:UDP-N-acetylglucosamine--N-acetylmuramyl-(pentapeptide) pyrophosphoryl-undecaprenol N-acetylglucosamine transferase
MHEFMAERPVMIAAGGTGGHVFPGLAVAMKLRDQNIPVIWVGTERGIESRVVPEWGVPLKLIKVTSLRGRGLLSTLRSGLNLVMAIVRSLQILLTVRPRVVLGMGGYVAGPVCLAARVTGCRMMVHEQNAVAGFTNRMLKRVANRVMEAMPGTFNNNAAAVFTGNPVRADILAVQPPEDRMADRGATVNVLVIGGSQGARALNEMVPAAMQQVSGALNIKHQAGGNLLQATRSSYDAVDHNVEVSAFIDDMAAAYAWADLIICRAGAMTVAEVAAVGLAAVFIPFPSAVDDHQTANGRYLVDAGAAVLMQESALTVDKLAAQINELINDRQRLLVMAQRGREASRRDATHRVVEELLGETA